MNQYQKFSHFLGPVYDENSKILILGTFPSAKSREYGFFYGHPQNRFWKVLTAVFECDFPQSIEDKRSFLLQNKIALWDVIASCEIIGSSDSSIKNVVPSDINQILQSSPIQNIYANGKTSEKLYKKYIEPKTGRKITALPSTSPANAAFTIEKLVSEWSRIRI